MFISARMAAFAALTISMASTASALTLNFDETSTSSNTTLTGASATVEMVFTDVGAGMVDIVTTVSNTTNTTGFGAGATESQLTGFGFDLLSGLSFIEADSSAGTALDNFLTGAVFNPFGELDVAAADNNNFLGGNARGALSEGDTDSVTFRLAYDQALFGGANSIEDAYLSAFVGNDVQAGMRFQSVNAGEGSDKLVANYSVTVVPVPASIFLLLSGLMGLGVARFTRYA